MRNLNVGLCAIVLALFGAVLLVEASPLGSDHLLGASHCTWGPSYWCSNLTNAKGCNAVRHCIQTVWEKHEVPVDNDGICKICKDMVTQARDQLRSNETMDEMRQVFEGSCKLIPIKLPRKECIKLVDDFIPELVEALSSQMNPDQVCSVAGLCNNAKYDELLQATYHAALAGEVPEDSSEEVATTTLKPKPQLSCGNCNQVASLIVQKFNAANRDVILENVLRFCGSMSSFSDACASIALTYFSDIYEHFQHNLNAPAVCHMSGSCVAKYHQHPEDLKEEAAIDFSTLSAQDDDIPCELCEQLVKHLRDVLVANTTEDEFKQVLQGLCSQSKGFKEECLSIVDQYYDVIYKSLVSNLDANGACFLIGVCPASANSAKLQNGDIRPLLPVLPPVELQVSIRPLLGANEPKFTQEELMNMQLPIDHLMGAANPLSLVEGGELCTICEYALHFIQETLATPATEDQIKETVQHVCDKMNKGLRGHCHDFVDMYGDAVIALLIQGLNPREICPKMQMCPPNEMDSEVFSPVTISIEEQDKPTCPLCIFAVEQAKSKIKDNKTKKNIQDVLDHLCSRLPTKLQGECVDFVKTYSKELIDMLITDFTSQEICVDLKLCSENRNYLIEMGIFFDKSNVSQEDGDSESSEIDMDIDDASLAFERDNSVRPDCLLCEQLIKMIEKRAGKQPTKSGLMKAMHHSCDKLRPRIQKNCHAFVDEYGEKIADLILAETEPKILCREMGFCVWSEQDDLEIDEAFKYNVVALPNERMTGMDDVSSTAAMKDIMVKDPPNCVLCEFLMTKLESELKNKSTQEEIRHAVEHICDVMPKTVSKSCNKFVEQYANTIIMLIDTMPPREICKSMKLCAANLDIVLTDSVIECGVCHGVSMALLPYFKQHLDESLISGNDMVAVGCENLPAKYFQICSEMILIYGQSMLHLAQQPHANEALICTQIGKCFDNEKSGMAFASISA